MKEVHELTKGTHFVWDMHPHYLHEMTDERDENGSPIANHVMTQGDSGWYAHEPRSQNWNPYCTVRIVKISVSSGVVDHGNLNPAVIAFILADPDLPDHEPLGLEHQLDCLVSKDAQRYKDNARKAYKAACATIVS